MIERCKQSGARLLLLAAFLFLVDSSCAKMIPIPEDDYRKTDPKRNEKYQLTTRDGRVYEFTRFGVTDSTLVILEVASYGGTPELYDASAIKTPVVVPWDDVKSLERYEYWNRGTVFVIVSGVVVVGFGLYLLFVAHAVSGALKSAG